MSAVPTLPAFPVDPETLNLLRLAIRPGTEAKRSSMGDLLVLMSELAGSDTDAVEEVTTSDSGTVYVMRDPQYHVHDVVIALADEVIRLRGENS